MAALEMGGTVDTAAALGFQSTVGPSKAAVARGNSAMDSTQNTLTGRQSAARISAAYLP